MSPALALGGDKLVARLSFTHFVELLAIEDALKRSFYEIECIRGNWSVRELKRQIANLKRQRRRLTSQISAMRADVEIDDSSFYRDYDDKILILGMSQSKQGAREVLMDILEQYLDDEGVFHWQ